MNLVIDGPAHARAVPNQRLRSIEMSLLHEVLSRADCLQRYEEVERERLARRVVRARRLERKAQRVARRADNAGWSARVAELRYL
jgi:hypothetical protein